MTDFWAVLVAKASYSFEETEESLQLTKIAVDVLNVIMQNGLYGIARDGRVIHQPLFKNVRRADDGYFAYCTYPYLVYKNRMTIIDKDGRDLCLTMYGNLEWEGESILKGHDINGGTLYWDKVYGKYYREKPEFVTLAGIEMAFFAIASVFCAKLVVFLQTAE